MFSWQVLILASLIAQVFVSRNSSPQAISLEESSLGKTLPIFYSVSNISAAQALSMLDNFGPDHIRLYPRDPMDAAADLTDLPNNDDETHFVGIGFDKIDFQSKFKSLQVHTVLRLEIWYSRGFEGCWGSILTVVNCGNAKSPV